MLAWNRAYKHQAQKGSIRHINLVLHQKSLEGWRPATVWYSNHICFNTTLKGRLVALAYSILMIFRNILTNLRSTRAAFRAKS